MDRIRNILQSIRPEFNFEKSKDFIRDGYLDSFDLLTLVTELEQEFRCSIDPMEIQAEYFVSVEAIAKLVKKSGGEI